MLHAFYPILPDYDWIARLIPLGVKTVQLRMKDEDTSTIRDAIAKSLEICRSNNCQLIVNDYWRDAINLSADYIHLGQEDLQEADISAIKKAGLKLGISTHSEEELDTALQHDPDYVALGPIYETKLKKMKWDPQGLARISQWKKRIEIPLVAIGGLTVERAESAFDAGANSLAVVTDIVADKDPEARTREWLKTVSPHAK